MKLSNFPSVHALLACGLVVLISSLTAACDDGGGHMASTANPHASRAALAMLDKGGSAVDAAIAAQLVLTLVEPQSSGIGGGAFLMHWEEEARKVTAYDGREKAPMAATPSLFLKESGDPMGFMEAVVGGRAVGVPGVLAMLKLAHDDHGRLAWKDLFAPAITLADNGFEVSARLHGMITGMKKLADHASTREVYFKDGKPLPVGHLLRNPAYAASLRSIAVNGPDAFYEGEIADAIVETARNHSNAGLITQQDLGAYEAKRRSPVCRPYRRYRVCGMPPPTSGGLTSLMILGLIEPYSISALRPGSPMAVHLISEASRLAYADRSLYMADADFADVPVGGLLDDGYLHGRSRLIDPGRSMGKASAGTPPRRSAQTLGANVDVSLPSTSHLAIVDRWGDAVSMTTSVEGPFGAHIMAGGFILNNQLTDFSFRPEVGGRPVANRVEPGKRPRSSMSPTIVLHENGDFFAAIGSPGGSRIITYVTQTLVALLDWDMDMQSAIDLPRHVNRNGGTELEAVDPLQDRADALRKLGHEVKVRTITSGLHGIRRTEAGLDGGADRRREGIVLGSQ